MKLELVKSVDITSEPLGVQLLRWQRDAEFYDGAVHVSQGTFNRLSQHFADELKQRFPDSIGRQFPGATQIIVAEGVDDEHVRIVLAWTMVQHPLYSGGNQS